MLEGIAKRGDARLAGAHFRRSRSLPTLLGVHAERLGVVVQRTATLVGPPAGELAALRPLPHEGWGDAEGVGEGGPVEEDRIGGHARMLTKCLFEKVTEVSQQNYWPAPSLVIRPTRCQCCSVSDHWRASSVARRSRVRAYSQMATPGPTRTPTMNAARTARTVTRSLRRRAAGAGVGRRPPRRRD